MPKCSQSSPGTLEQGAKLRAYASLALCGAWLHDSLSASEKSGAFWYLDRFGYSDPTVVQGVFPKDMSLREAVFMIQPLSVFTAFGVRLDCPPVG